MVRNRWDDPENKNSEDDRLEAKLKDLHKALGSFFDYTHL